MAKGQVQRKLAAILAADVVGYSRLMGQDEVGTLATLTAHRQQLIDPNIVAHHGRVFKTTGDGILAEFASAVEAVNCAMAIQDGINASNVTILPEKRLEFRIGVNVGDVIVEAEDVYGDGVNVAARLEALAEPGTVNISGVTYDHVAGKIEAAFDDLGPQTVKNIARSIRVLRVRPTQTKVPVGDVSAPVRGFQGRPAIAVLPLLNMSGDPEQEYFADGIAEDILTRLAMWRWLPVIARNSSFAYKDKKIDIRQVGRELGARYLLEGSVRKTASRVRITGQLIDAQTGHHVWAGHYDRALDDVFAVQDEITNAIVAALEPAVGRAELQRVALKPPSSLDAWELYLRAAWQMSRYTKGDLAAAREASLLATQLDSSFARPHAIRALISSIEILLGLADDPGASLREAQSEAQIAVSLDPMDAFAYGALRTSNLFLRQHDAGIAAGRRATELNPSFAFGQYLYGILLMMSGNSQDAIGPISQAIRISAGDPLHYIFYGGLGLAFYTKRDYEKAVEATLSAVQHAPQNAIGWRNHAAALAQLGRLNEAHTALEYFLQMTPGFTLDVARRMAPFRSDTDFEHYAEGLRKAGWSG